METVLSLVIVLLVIFLVPIVIYGLFSKFFALAEPEKKASFFVSVLVQKVGTAIGFVWLYMIADRPDWLIYSLAWVIMFAIVEIGQAISSTYSKKEAIAGIISEVIYFPLAAYLVSLLI